MIKEKSWGSSKKEKSKKLFPIVCLLLTAKQLQLEKIQSSIQPKRKKEEKPMKEKR